MNHTKPNTRQLAESVKGRLPVLLKVHKVFLNDKPIVQNVSVDAPPGVSLVTHFFTYTCIWSYDVYLHMMFRYF